MWCEQIHNYQRIFINLSNMVEFFVKIVRSSCPEVLYKKGVLKDCTKFTGKHLCQSLFYNNVAGLRLATLLKKTLAQMFPCEFCKNFKNTFFYKAPPGGCFWIGFWIVNGSFSKSNFRSKWNILKIMTFNPNLPGGEGVWFFEKCIF